MIDARALKAWLGNKKDFSNWISARIEDYGFVEGSDFTTIKLKTGGRPRIDYLLTVDMAKELSMVERTGAIRLTQCPILSPCPVTATTFAPSRSKGSRGSARQMYAAFFTAARRG